MATKTAGTKTTTSLTAIQWKPGNGVSAADLATINEIIKNPNNSAAPLDSCRIENGFLFLPGKKAPNGIELQANDWICVDGAGWAIVIPDIIFSTSWQHS